MANANVFVRLLHMMIWTKARYDHIMLNWDNKLKINCSFYFSRTRGTLLATLSEKIRKTTMPMQRFLSSWEMIVYFTRPLGKFIQKYDDSWIMHILSEDIVISTIWFRRLRTCKLHGFQWILLVKCEYTNVKRSGIYGYDKKNVLIIDWEPTAVW